MSGRYEPVNARDDEDPDTPTSPTQHAQPIPNSPPPSFHSRASSLLSRERTNENVDSTLADAFDDSDGDSDNEADDRQRLVRGNSFPVNSSTAATSTNTNATNGSNGAQRPVPRAGGSRVYGGGIQSDGVFSNLAAKPEANAPEKEEMPPTYEQAALDAAPPYWEQTILAPGLLGDEVYVEGMPVGSFFSFIWNGMISMSFQFVGFLLTYLLHSTHAAKNGSRAGLGITLIQYGFYMKGTSDSAAGGMASSEDGDGYASPPDPNVHDFDPGAVTGDKNGGGVSDMQSSEFVAYILMIVGWFILIRAISDYLRARRHEQLVLQSPDRGLGIPIIAEGERAETVV